MNRKLARVRTDIRKAEAKLREHEEYVKTLRERERQLEDEIIIDEIRAMQEKDGDVLDLLRSIREMNQRNRDAGPNEKKENTNAEE